MCVGMRVPVEFPLMLTRLGMQHAVHLPVRGIDELETPEQLGDSTLGQRRAHQSVCVR